MLRSRRAFRAYDQGNDKEQLYRAGSTVNREAQNSANLVTGNGFPDPYSVRVPLMGRCRCTISMSDRETDFESRCSNF